MSLPDFDQLYQNADDLRQPVEVAVAGGADATVLRALRIAVDRGWVRPILVSPEADIRRIAHDCDVDLGRFAIVDTDDVATAAVAQVRNGSARMLMKGAVSTPELISTVLDQEHGLRTDRVLAQVVFMEISASGMRFLLADTGICIQPTLDQKIDILRSAVRVAQELGARAPRVALMAATETITKKMPETIDAQRIEELARSGEFPNCNVSGPLSFDLAYSLDAVEKKHSRGPVAGVADVMIFPNLVSANLTVKAIMYTANCRFGGLLVGASCPVVFMSRADTTETRLNSLALALMTGRLDAG
ncbi:MAG: phosphate butyryltransferase [Planctomycetes bacterium]|nr:phosphate butyryltransferase [Planctomycetota bacterium]